MELDEMSNNSTISNLSNCQNDFHFFFDSEDIIYTPNVEEIIPQVNNVISTVNLGNYLNLKNIALQLKNVEYNANKSSNLIIRTKNNKISATIFSNGKMICSGAKNEKESKSACLKFSKIVKKLGYKIELKDFKIQNIIASYDTKFEISLPKLYNEINNFINNSKKLGNNNNNYCKFNNEGFPGLIVYMNDSKINILIFESGKVVISGAKKRKEIDDIFKNIYPLLVESKNVYNEEK